MNSIIYKQLLSRSFASSHTSLRAIRASKGLINKSKGIQNSNIGYLVSRMTRGFAQGPGFNDGTNQPYLRHQFNGYPIYGKTFSILRDSILLSCYPFKAGYKFENNAYAVERSGYILFELVPRKSQVNEEGVETFTYDNENRIKIALGQFQLTQILTYDVEEAVEKKLEQELYFEKPTGYNNTINSFKISNSEGRFNLSLASFQGESAIGMHTICLTKRELIVLQNMIQYALPLVLGWEGILSPQDNLNHIAAPASFSNNLQGQQSYKQAEPKKQDNDPFKY